MRRRSVGLIPALVLLSALVVSPCLAKVEEEGEEVVGELLEVADFVAGLWRREDGVGLDLVIVTIAIGGVGRLSRGEKQLHR